MSSSTSLAEALDSPSTFKTKLTIGWIGLTSCAYFIVFILKRIELNKSLKRKPRFGKDIGADTALTVDFASPSSLSSLPPSINKNHSNTSTATNSSTDSNGNVNVNSNGKNTTSTTTLDTPGHSSAFEAHIHNLASKPPSPSSFEYHETNNSSHHLFHNDDHDDDHDTTGTPKFTRSRLTLEEKLILYILTFLLLFLTYLLLVYLPSGAMASLFGTLSMSIVIFKTQVSDEIRRRRYDRLGAILTLIIFAASFLSLITYASVGLKEGTIYEGPARIIGYDTSTYETHGNVKSSSSSTSSKKNKGGANDEVFATRMDLEVAWGGDWGCPDYNGVECQAFVSGALCETDEVENRHDKRQLETAVTSTKATTTNSTKVDNNDNSNEDEESVEEMEEEIEELKAENDKLKKENSQLDQKVVVEDKEVINAVNAANELSNEEKNEENLVKYYKEEVVEEAEDVVIEAGELLEEEVVAEYYADVAVQEEEVLDELGENEIVKEIEDESLDYYVKEVVAVEDVVDEELNVLEDQIDEIEEGGDVDVSQEATDVVYDIEEEVYDAILDAEEGGDEESSDEKEVSDEKESSDEKASEEVAEGKGSSDDQNDYDQVINELEEKEVEVEEKIDEEIAEGGDEEVIEEDEEVELEIEGEIIEEEEIKEDVENYYSSYNYQYSFDDDMFEDDWWSSSWTDVWGEYACNDLFNSDVEGKSFDSSTKPGTDEWPFVNIYGSCNRCEAYLVDYYSTEHFNKIREYQTHAVNYALVGMVGLGLTLSLAYRQYVTPGVDRDPENLYGQMV